MKKKGILGSFWAVAKALSWSGLFTSEVKNIAAGPRHMKKEDLPVKVVGETYEKVLHRLEGDRRYRSNVKILSEQNRIQRAHRKRMRRLERYGRLNRFEQAAEERYQAMAGSVGQ